MSDYEELVERIAPYVWDYDREKAGAILAEVLRTLETVTPEMNAAIKFRAMPRPTWLAMLRASPLAPNCGGITS